MSDPYRDAQHRDPAEAPRDRGIVGDVIAQFADPNAFYRELVQNSIDAGSPEIIVELAYDADAQRMRVAVRDRGGGMTREIIENQLLVLFRSTKEQDRTKIGKFGIGFSSVLAPDPEVVVITSARDGKRLTCHLYRDLSYELFDSGRATHAGTTVELEIVMAREQVGAFCAASEASLRRWCRHASVPIELAIKDGDERSAVRIDRPLDIEGALVEVRYTTDSGQLTVVAGLTAQAKPYLGLFNHGLTLVEVDDNIVGNVAVKVQDTRLGHTLSRDDVRRDSHYDHALATVRNVVQERLPPAVAARMRELAEQDNDAAYHALVDATVRAGISPASWHFPLLEPLGEARSIAGAALPGVVWGAARPSAVTATLASARVPVLRATDRDLLAQALDAAAGARLGDPDRELTAVTRIDPTDVDMSLLMMIGELFDKVHRAPAQLLLVELAGARDDLMSVALKAADSRVIDRDDAGKNPFAFFGRRILALSTSHPHIKAARESDDPVTAAGHVVRAVLLQHGLLDADRSAAILESTLAGLGVTR